MASLNGTAFAPTPITERAALSLSRNFEPGLVNTEWQTLYRFRRRYPAFFDRTGPILENCGPVDSWAGVYGGLNNITRPQQ
jgi:hypothetical protein